MAKDAEFNKGAKGQTVVPDAVHQGILDRVKAKQEKAAEANKARDAEAAKAAKK